MAIAERRFFEDMRISQRKTLNATIALKPISSTEMRMRGPDVHDIHHDGIRAVRDRPCPMNGGVTPLVGHGALTQLGVGISIGEFCECWSF